MRVRAVENSALSARVILINFFVGLESDQRPVGEHLGIRHPRQRAADARVRPDDFALLNDLDPGQTLIGSILITSTSGGDVVIDNFVFFVTG